MIKIIKHWLEAIQKYNEVVETLDGLKKMYDIKMQENEVLFKQNVQLVEDSVEMKKKIEILTKKPGVDDRNYWDNKWVQSKIYYNAPERKYVCDYITYRPIKEITKTAGELIIKYGLNKNNPDDVLYWVMNWIKVSSGFKYIPESKEVWDKPEDFLMNNGGDCDGFGVFMFFLIREIFKQLKIWDKVNHRLKCADGHVFYARDTIATYAGRHFYLLWLHSIGEWEVIETTWNIELAISNYGKDYTRFFDSYPLINYTFTEYASFAQRNLYVNRRFDKI